MEIEDKKQELLEMDQALKERNWELKQRAAQVGFLNYILMKFSVKNNHTRFQRSLLFGKIDIFIAFLKKIIYLFWCVRSLLLCAGFLYSSLLCVCFSLWWLLLLRSMGSRRAGFSRGAWAQ